VLIANIAFTSSIFGSFDLNEHVGLLNTTVSRIATMIRCFFGSDTPMNKAVARLCPSDHPESFRRCRGEIRESGLTESICGGLPRLKG